MAWIGIPLRDDPKLVKPAAWAGPNADSFTRDLRVGWDGDRRGDSTVARAIRTGEQQTVNNVPDDPGSAPWAALAREYDVASITSLPLKIGAEVVAVLVIYGAATNAFDAEELSLLQELADDVAYGLRALRARAEHEALNERWRVSLEATIGALASTVELRDPYTAGHQQRVAKLAVEIATKMGLVPHEIHGLYLAGIVHDIGKITIPAEILNKPGRLSQIEYQLIQGHVQAGYDILKGVDFPWPIAEIVRQHHERLDGSGYPQGLKSDEILKEAKILAVADVVEAMMSHRPYRPALGLAVALAEIEKNSGRFYDPDVVATCREVFDEELIDSKPRSA
jgi:putative nucleotidyltransferase with HDIG domain